MSSLAIIPEDFAATAERVARQLAELARMAEVGLTLCRQIAAKVREYHYSVTLPWSDAGALLPSKASTPSAKAISVAIGMPMPSWVGVPALSA